jgi:hypothetical protein
MNSDAKRSTDDTPQATREADELEETETDSLTGGGGPITSGASLGMD